VFQDPAASFNPRHTLARSLYEPLQIHHFAPQSLTPLLEELQLSTDLLQRYPHQLSGGQQQRMALARALALQPDCLILDEVTSALDPALVTQLLETLRSLRSRRPVTLLLISHDLSAVSALCDRLLVFHQGHLVEDGPTSSVMSAPKEPYTQLLLSSIPAQHPSKRKWVNS
jgi:peptide/nickel transport system ATP-binding protein